MLERRKLNRINRRMKQLVEQLKQEIAVFEEWAEDGMYFRGHFIKVAMICLKLADLQYKQEELIDYLESAGDESVQRARSLKFA